MQVAVAIACGAPVNSANACSNSFTRGPWVSVEPSSTSSAARRSSLPSSGAPKGMSVAMRRGRLVALSALLPSTMSTTLTNSTFITIRDAARRLDVHENTVRRYVDRGLIGAVRLPSGVRRVQRADVEALEADRVGSGGEPGSLGLDGPATPTDKAIVSAWAKPIDDVADLAIPGFWESDEELEEFVAMTRYERDHDR